MRFKNIIKPIIFISIFLLILITLTPFFVKNTVGKGIEFEEKDTIDYFVIGDSEAYTSISPMEIWNKYGFAGYNLGLSGQRLQEIYYLLERAIENQTPKVVMLETNAIYTSFKMYDETTRVVQSILGNNFKIYQYHNRWKDFTFGIAKNNNTNSNKEKINIMKGFHYNNKIKPYTKGNYINKTDEVKEIKKVPLYYLDKIVELCKEKNIQLILYSAPTPHNWTYEKHNGVKNFAKENNLPLIDLNLKNDELKIDWLKETYDKGDHMNFSGAKKVTDYMGEYLSKNTNLIDRRQDKEYESWNETWKKYLNKINKK
ncbi:hypothetical protein JCM1393_09100 [Clostridium carnis]